MTCELSQEAGGARHRCLTVSVWRFAAATPCPPDPDSVQVEEHPTAQRVDALLLLLLLYRPRGGVAMTQSV
jgi:hypothetical protein